MRSIALSLVLFFLLVESGCVGRRRGGGGDDDDDVTTDGDADADADADADGDGDVDGDADGDADPCGVLDRDGDGHLALVCGGDDCNDRDEAIHPGAPDGGTWATDTVWPTAVYYPAIAVDGDGVGHAAFTIYDSALGRASLGYASNIGGVWVGAEIVSGSSTGWQPSIAVDAGGDVHIAYYDSASTSTVYYVTNGTGAWVTRSIGTGYGEALTVDDAGHVYIAFTKSDGNTSLAIATNASGAWATSTIDDTTTSTGYYPEIALDSAGHVHIAYVDYTSSAIVRYATNANGGWSRQQVAAGGGDMMGLAIDSGDDPHVTYGGWDVNGASLGVRHATNASGAWVSETIDADGMYSDAVIDASDTLHVVYTNTAYTSVRYATNASGRWQSETLVSDGGSYYYPEVALGGGAVHTVYQTTSTAAHSGRAAPDGIDQDCNGIEF